MINCTLESLTPDAADQLRRWMDAPEAKTFLRCVNALVKNAEVKALNAGVQGARFPGLQDLVRGNLEEAQRYQACIDVFEELVKDQKFVVATLT